MRVRPGRLDPTLRAAGIAVALLLGANASAHETWILPSAFRVSPGEPVRFDVSSGMAFPAFENPILAERVASASCRLGGARQELSGLAAGKTSLFVSRTLQKAGVATIALDLKPKEIELSDNEVAEYLAEIGASDGVRSAWAARKGKTPWRETYTKHVKTFVAVGSIEGDSSWRDPVGAALELVPQSSPFGLRAGAKFSVLLFAGSKPVPGIAIGLLTEGAEQRVLQTTDENGAATFTLSRAGRAMLSAVSLREGRDGASWVSDFATLTFEVGR